MGATYLSMQLRTDDRDAAVAAVEAISTTNLAAGLRFYVAEPIGGWLAVYPNFTPELERSAKTLSLKLGCLIVLLLSADEDELYCMFFRDGKQLAWFKVGAPRKRTAKSATSSQPSSKRSPACATLAAAHACWRSWRIRRA